MRELFYLLVIESNSSTIITIADGDAITLGAAEGASIPLTCPDAEPCHALISLDAGRLLLDSRGPGLELNGHGTLGIRPLNVEDLIEVAGVSVIVKRRAEHPKSAELIGEAELRHRLAQEIERSLRRQRHVALGVVELETTSEVLERSSLEATLVNAFRYEDLISWDTENEILFVLPDTDDKASIPLERLLAELRQTIPTARCGLALCPDDARSVEGLISGARTAAAAADRGRLRRLSEVRAFRRAGPASIIAIDPTMQRLIDLVERLAQSDMPVLLAGETGVGKEVFALALHHWSPRATGPMVSVNCAALTETLFESELFGHVKGAFTGAVSDKPGLLEKAAGGTLFLDEIGECPSASQAKLLRVLETRRASRVGSLDEYSIDARFIAATNRDLDAEVETRRFRRDLFFRLNTARIFIPPLRERQLEIQPLAKHFLEGAAAREDRESPSFSREAVQLLSLYTWPGNVRELKNLMEYLAAVVDEPVLRAEQLPSSIAKAAPPWLGGRGAASSTEKGAPSQRQFRNIAEEVAELERTRMIEALQETKGTRKTAAALIGMPLRTFVSKLKKYEIDMPKGPTKKST